MGGRQYAVFSSVRIRFSVSSRVACSLFVVRYIHVRLQSSSADMPCSFLRVSTVACWVFNAPVLLAIRVLWARVGFAVVPPAPLVTAALLSAARASDCRMPPARRRRRQSHSVSA